jgi:hypothetical protein
MFDGPLDSDGAANDSLDFDGTEDGIDDGSQRSLQLHSTYVSLL